jgi:hypothetical protein
MKRYLLIAVAVWGFTACKAGGSGGTENPGIAGTTGASGTTGGAGTAGGAGTIGSAGSTGGAGTTGGAGATGTAGTTGTGGTAGTTGSAGATGSAGRGGTTGNAGTTGTAGTTGNAGTTGTGGAATADQNVPERNKNPSRDGHFVQPTITKAAAGMMMADAAFNTAATFTGNVAASPLFLDGPSGGLFIIPTGSGDVIARTERGMMAWTRNIGAPATAMIGCSSSSTPPLGILSTPAIDVQSRTIYVAGITGNASGVMAQIASAINADDGTVKSGWPVNLSTAVSFDHKIHNQRGALSLVGGILYVPYGSYNADCGSYRGRVVTIDTANPTTIGQWQASDMGDGIWASGGMASDGSGVFAVTGNTVPLFSTVATHGDSEQVTRITGMGTKADFFYPSNWMSMDTGDFDLGAVNPMVITLPGATPSKLVVAIAKDGKGFLLDADQLRGTSSGNAAGGQKLMFTVAANTAVFGAPSAPASYRTASGTYVVITMNMASGCPGGGTGRQVVAVRIAPNPLAATIAWCAPMSGGPTSPIATTTDGTSDAIVWFTSNNQLRGVDGDTGAMIYGGTTACGGSIQKWTSPIAVKGRIVAAANDRLCAWGVPGALTQAQAAPAKAGKHKREVAVTTRSTGL